MLQVEHYVIFLTSIKLPFSIKTLVLYIFKWPLKTGFTCIHTNLLLESVVSYFQKELLWILISFLILVLLNQDSSFLENTVDPDQLASDEAV